MLPSRDYAYPHRACRWAYGDSALTKEDIVKMARSGVGDEVIVRQIQAKGMFDLTADEIVRVKEAGVSDEVIEAMVESGERRPPEPVYHIQYAPYSFRLYGWYYDWYQRPYRWLGRYRPYRRHDSEPLRTVLGDEDRVVDELVRIFGQAYGVEVSRELIRTSPEAPLFGRPDGNESFDVLPGRYRVEVRVLANHEDDAVGSIRVVVGGAVYGAMGTDALGRDLAVGLLYGLPIALLIGVATATVSTFLGMTLGMISGYTGGWVDVAIQRAADIVANVPVLPLLIFLVFIVGSQLWLILLILVAFSWPGLTIMVRTMVLQLRTGQEVETARALGASALRVIYRHILPHAASYVLAQLVFFAPSAILAEAGLSFLGLGDPTIPTWGQILEYGFRTGAVFLGYWWWVIPPGLLIVLTAVTFMFLALGLEPVVDPRLRGKRSWHF